MSKTVDIGNIQVESVIVSLNRRPCFGKISPSFMGQTYTSSFLNFLLWHVIAIFYVLHAINKWIAMSLSLVNCKAFGTKEGELRASIEIETSINIFYSTK